MVWFVGLNSILAIELDSLEFLRVSFHGPGRGRMATGAGAPGRPGLQSMGVLENL